MAIFNSKLLVYQRVLSAIHSVLFSVAVRQHAHLLQVLFGCVPHGILALSAIAIYSWSGIPLDPDPLVARFATWLLVTLWL